MTKKYVKSTIHILLEIEDEGQDLDGTACDALSQTLWGLHPFVKDWAYVKADSDPTVDRWEVTPLVEGQFAEGDFLV